MFYCAKSIKHIKDCTICIKLNESNLDDNFYNNLIKTKYYQPIPDGIYSIKDKKLFSFEDSSDIQLLINQ